MGDDGHTASLFPGSSALEEHEKRVVPVQGPKPPPWRISITPPVIADAGSILVMVAGRAKAPMLARALQGPINPKLVPIHLAIEGTWIIDAAAAENLRATGK
jgi:6-phosphogluconolactonase